MSFALLGFAFLIMDAKDARLRMLARTFALLVFIIGYTGIIGYLFDTQALYRVGSSSAFPVQGAVMLVLATVAFLFLRPTRGLTRVISQDDVRGLLLRRLLPAVLLGAPLLAWLQTRATQTPGTADSVVVALGTVVLLVVLIWWVAKTIDSAVAQRDRAEATRKATEERLQWALEAAGGGAWDWDLMRNESWWSPEMYTLWRFAQNDAHRLGQLLGSDRSARSTICR